MAGFSNSVGVLDSFWSKKNMIFCQYLFFYTAGCLVIPTHYFLLRDELSLSPVSEFPGCTVLITCTLLREGRCVSLC